MTAALEDLNETGTTALVTVYSMPSCVQCKATYRALDRKKIAYEIVDVTTDPEAEARVKALGYVQAPVVMVGGEHWSGFRPDKINKLVNA